MFEIFLSTQYRMLQNTLTIRTIQRTPDMVPNYIPYCLMMVQSMHQLLPDTYEHMWLYLVHSLDEWFHRRMPSSIRTNCKYQDYIEWLQSYRQRIRERLVYQCNHVILIDFRFHRFGLDLTPSIETIRPKTSMFHSSCSHMTLSHLKLQYSQTLFPHCIYSLSFSFVGLRDMMQSKQTT